MEEYLGMGLIVNDLFVSCQYLTRETEGQKCRERGFCWGQFVCALVFVWFRVKFDGCKNSYGDGQNASEHYTSKAVEQIVES